MKKTELIGLSIMLFSPLFAYYFEYYAFIIWGLGFTLWLAALVDE